MLRSLVGSEMCIRDSLVVGDPFGATTHTDLTLRARERGIQVQVVHNASIMNAAGCSGLQLYRFGETVSIPWFQGTWKPDSFYDRIKSNTDADLHTLCLLDIKVKEPNLEMLARGKTVYEPPRYMSVNTAIEQLLEIEQTRGMNVIDEHTICVGLARVGALDQVIAAGPMAALRSHDMGAPLHSLIICAPTLHELELSYMKEFQVAEMSIEEHSARLQARACAVEQPAAQQEDTEEDDNDDDTEEDDRLRQLILEAESHVQKLKQHRQLTKQARALARGAACKTAKPAVKAVRKAAPPAPRDEESSDDGGADFDMGAAAEDDLDCLLADDF
eukprot:TRINITY_DN3115_c0_g1_i4.p2 TRINITY_DN3115_c0_g1~~TRINITY_DN3115_c0_g1_i4.p2  ORF type:complete len:331 (+),score=94.10 TRINITY_DN3115_c0_g1_i4:93-1085(+)